MKLASLLLVLVLGFSSGCTILGQQTLELNVSNATAHVLQDIDRDLRASGAEVRLDCFVSACKVRIDGSRQPALESEMISHPFTGEPMVHRIHGGTQALAGALYAALGRHTETTDFQGHHDSRVLNLESTSGAEQDGLKFRCISDRAAQPTYECWILVSAKILR